MKVLLTLLFVIPMAFAQESAFDGVKELTEQEEYDSQHYIHQGIADKRYAEMCAEGKGGYKDICTNNRSAFSSGAMKDIENMLPAVTMAYTMIMNIGGTEFKSESYKNKTEGVDQNISKSEFEKLPADQQKGFEKKTEKKEDYCRYIPMAGQAINIGMMKGQNEKNQQAYTMTKPEARQAASFYTLAKTHKDHAKASKLQMGVWGATTGCYAAYLAMANVSGDWKIYAKMAGSTLLTLFYKKKTDAHKERAKLLEQMAQDLPHAGECNPFTHTSCFCNEETSFSSDSANFNKFCVPDPFVARNKKNDAVTCVTQNGKADPACSCEKKNTCIDRVLQAGALDFGVSPTIMKDPLAGIKPLSDGYGTGNLDSATNRNLANAKKALAKYQPSGPLNLNDKQKKMAKRLNKLGIPKAAAAMMAKRGGSFSGGQSAASLLAGLGSEEDKVANKVNIPPLNRKKNVYSAGKNIKSKRSTQTNNPFGRFKNKKSKGKGGVEIEGSYAKKATAAAEITRDSGKNIFKIINNRYQLSGWRQFPEAFKIESEPPVTEPTETIE